MKEFDEDKVMFGRSLFNKDADQREIYVQRYSLGKFSAKTIVISMNKGIQQPENLMLRNQARSLSKESDSSDRAEP